MSTTPNLDIVLLSASQALKEITTSTALLALDAAMCANKAEVMTDADFVLPSTDFVSGIFFKFTGVLSAGRNVTLPTGSARVIIVQNDTQNAAGSIDRFPLTFRVGTYSTIFVTPDANAHLIYSDGIGNVSQCS